eukprot:7553073-Alexandrium_andersonii.AAC.1
MRLSLLTTAHQANDGRGWTPRATSATTTYTTHSKVHMRRGETCPAAQPLEATQRATDVDTIEQARAKAQSTNIP